MKTQKPFYIRNTCRCCDSSELRMVLPMEPSPPGDEYLDSPDLEPSPVAPMDVWQCQQCGHAQLRCVYDPDVLYGKFSYETQISLGLDRHFDGYASEAISVANLKPNDFVVDIGSNDGTLLSKFKSKGLKVLGIDPAKQAAESAEKRGVETWIKYFDKNTAEEILKKKGSPSLITSNNTFANIDNLKAFIDSIRHLMNEKSTFVMETGYGPAIAEKGLFETIYHEHLGYFGLGDLLHLMRSSDLDLIDASINNSKQGCVRAYFKKSSKQSILDTCPILRAEISSKYKNGQSWLELGKKITKERAKIKSYLENEANRLASFGASVGSTTFILNMGLQDHLGCLYDDNRKKIGKYSPVKKIPVLKYDKDESKNTTIIINSWRYAGAILESHGGGKGTKWISVWPSFQIHE